LMGGVWVWFGIEPETNDRSRDLFFFLGVVYVLIGLGLFRDKRWCRGVAMVAWIPVMWMFPIGTVLGFVAMMLLRNSREEREEFLKVVDATSAEDAARMLKEQAMSRFGIREDQLNVSLAGGLKISPGEINGFLADMEEDYGFCLADEVNVSTVSVQEMMAVLARQKGRGA